MILVGDFKLHIDDTSNSSASDFLNITESFNLVHPVSGLTQNHGHTLDLVFTLGLDLNNVSMMDLSVSYHQCILFDTWFQAAPNSCKRTTQFWVVAEHTSNSFCSLYNKEKKQLDFLFSYKPAARKIKLSNVTREGALLY